MSFPMMILFAVFGVVLAIVAMCVLQIARLRSIGNILEGPLRLVRGDKVLAELTDSSPDMPFFYYKFHPRPEFEQIRPLFEVELRLLNEERIEEWELAYHRIEQLKPRLKLVKGRRSIRRFILHVEGDVAWVRDDIRSLWPLTMLR